MKSAPTFSLLWTNATRDVSSTATCVTTTSPARTVAWGCVQQIRLQRGSRRRFTLSTINCPRTPAPKIPTGCPQTPDKGGAPAGVTRG